MIVISCLRVLHFSYSKNLYQYSTKLWSVIFSTLSLGQAFLLGLLCTITIYDDSFQPISNVYLLSMGGIAGGALTALSPRLWLAITNLSFLLLPSIIVSFFSEGNMAYSILLSIYFSYLLLLGIRSNKEYLRAFHIEKQLEVQKQELKALNKIDPLTHIYNRGHFNTAYELQWHSSLRHQVQQSLLLLDVDNFKKINDKHGHLFGDECLIHIAKVIHDTAKRKTDIIARFGGEEFVVLLSGTSLEKAQEIAETMRKEIEQHPFIYKNKKLTVTTSIGVSNIIPTSNINPNLLIEQADTALYQAKSEGRNRVCTYE